MQFMSQVFRKIPFTFCRFGLRTNLNKATETGEPQKDKQDQRRKEEQQYLPLSLATLILSGTRSALTLLTWNRSMLRFLTKSLSRHAQWTSIFVSFCLVV